MAIVTGNGCDFTCLIQGVGAELVIIHCEIDGAAPRFELLAQCDERFKSGAIHERYAVEVNNKHWPAHA